MNSFSFNDAIRFRLATQQEDTNAKIQVFIGVFLGVILRWVYSVAVDVIKNQAPWCFGTWTAILIRFFRILAESQRSARQYAILEFTGLWNYHRCYRDFLVAPCGLLRLENLRD